MEMILDLLNRGVTERELLADYPDLESKNFRECFAYAKVVVATEKMEYVNLRAA